MLTFDFYSPEEEISHPLYRQKKVQVFIKRDDLIHPYLSGNKWRKLKYPLQEARRQGKQRLITFGGAWSNHLLATACAGAKFGFQTFGFVRGEAVENPVLKLCSLFGMRLLFVDRTGYRDKRGLFDQHFADDHEAFFIDEGGYSTLAAKGCSEMISELEKSYDHICCASGTGATAAGLLQGIQQAQLTTQLQVVPVLKGGQFIQKAIADLGVSLDHRLTLQLDYHFGGYAKTTPELIAFVKAFTQRTGILIEPTYTGKLCFALHDMLQKDLIDPGQRILLVHTGGLTGLLGMLNKFDD
ncbi:1-aminocyclopropane-1-carboxylate deaminase/D-cysteine desulfhydrase [Sphingobacterium griseoflavum]|uniref:1-aminocyclopropane-1-carboxylate deaminase n=1 Tax=Sphingobacterium griseoflavum TaxID=1474952 RepID=A0ABQ3HWB6_9SPHI|nr:pyridoxal-phosphate dependent enzyme [Sphingobacterium griseoflavum]GHE32570.1 1-aminocyclopropane-1-carboxylate deaminase [Sphingobacterium griseoflavum]